MEAHHHSVNPDTGRNSVGRRILKKIHLLVLTQSESVIHVLKKVVNLSCYYFIHKIDKIRGCLEAI